MSAKRSRLECPYCQEILSYSSYRRHIETKLCCKSESNSNDALSHHNDSGNPDVYDTCDAHLQECDDYTTDQSIANDTHDKKLDSEIPSEPDSSCTESLAPEIWPEDPEPDADSVESEKMPHESNHKLLCTISFFLLFFQLCYKISDRAIKHLLDFLFAILSCFPNFLLDGFPLTLYSLKKMLYIKSDLKSYCVCPTCHKLYDIDNCPDKCDHVEFPNHPQQQYRQKCGTELQKSIKVNQKYKLVPRKVYVYNSIAQTLQKLMSRPGFYKNCEVWRKFNTSSEFMTDLYDGKLWQKEWKEYLEVPGNLLLMLNVDWFRVFKHSSYSVGMIYLVIQNLPRSLRFKPENIIIVGSIPGRHEPKLTINSYLKPMVDELLHLYKGIRLQCNDSVFGYRTVRVALGLICCDIPATRKLCGFYGFKALHGCSKCLKKFPKSSNTGPNDYSGFQRDTWELRDLDRHRDAANKALQAESNAARDKIQSKLGVRHSELLRLRYFNIVRCHLIDPMHNLFLGTCKHVFNLWKENGILNEAICELIQQKVDSLITPVHSGRLPGKIATASGFSGFTAEQWMIWTTVYSPFMLKDVIPTIHYEMWCKFSKSCSLMCRPFMHSLEIKKADELMIDFCQSFEEIFGKSCVTPNMHLHGHLRQCIEDVGPIHSFWCYSFERYNGLLESFKKSWHAPEVQIMEKFSLMQTLNATVIEMPNEFKSCLNALKQNCVLLDNENCITDSEILLQYEKNLFLPPKDICALQLPFQNINPPLKEKILFEEARQHLWNMYNAIYSAENVTHVPLHYEEFNQIEIFNQIYTASKTNTKRSTTVIAIWPSLTGKILTRDYRSEDVRAGIIEYFMLHTPIIKGQIEKPHILAKVKWFDDHVRKNWFKNSTIVACTLFSSETEASFIPLSRIMSRCMCQKQSNASI